MVHMLERGLNSLLLDDTFFGKRPAAPKLLEPDPTTLAYDCGCDCDASDFPSRGCMLSRS